MSLTDTTPDAAGALYNRYRPRRLSELVGQDHVAVPLRRAFEKGRIHHAYLLSGPRGCGKTSTARILAAGLVCDNGPTAEPCNTCEQCTSVIKGNHLDVIELDAASNGGVDDARELRERAHFSPAIARFKVIVVDEAHMVTTAGFNALLKLIEEPPPHIRFIFATTNPEKVLATIRSRTYHYGFRLVPAPALAAHLQAIVTRENHTLDDGVLALVLRAGGGSMRDSLGILGQLLDGSDNTHVHLHEAAALLGATADTILDKMVEAFASRDTATLLATIGEAIDTGVDPRRLAEDILDRLRDLLLLATTGQLPPLAEIASPQSQAAWQSAVQRLGVRGLTIACEVLQTAAANMHAGQPRITLEVAAARVLLGLADSVDTHAALRALTQQVTEMAQTITTPRPNLMPEVYAAPPALDASPRVSAVAPAQVAEPAPTSTDLVPSSNTETGHQPAAENPLPPAPTGPASNETPPLTGSTATSHVSGNSTEPTASAPNPPHGSYAYDYIPDEPDTSTPSPAAVTEPAPAPPAVSPLASIGTIVEDIPNPSPPPVPAHVTSAQPLTPAPSAEAVSAPVPPAPVNPAPLAAAVEPAPAPAWAPTPTATPTPDAWGTEPAQDGWSTPTTDLTPTAPAPVATPTGDASTHWPRVLDALAAKKRSAWMALNGSQYNLLSLGNHQITIAVPTPGAGDGFRNSGNEQLLIEAANETLGGTWVVTYQSAA